MCDYCEDYSAQDYMVYIEGHGQVCECCVERHFFVCAECHETTHGNEEVDGADNHSYCSSDCMLENNFVCEDCEEVFVNNKRKVDEKTDESLCPCCHTERGEEIDTN